MIPRWLGHAPETDLVQNCYHAEALLKTLLDPANAPKVERDVASSDNSYLYAQLASLPKITYSKMAFWISLGEVLGGLRDADTEVKLTDVKSAVPRTYAIGGAESPDSVRTRLFNVERALNENPNPNHLSEDVVARLAPMIEALAKRVWPEAFTPPNWDGKLVSVYHGKLYSSSELEERFANISLTLHKSYRNPANHDFDKFKCSFEEARFFLTGVRTLVDLWERISQGQK